MDDTDQMIHILSETIVELKKGIMDYSAMMNRLPPEQLAQAQNYMKEMHHIAIKLQHGVDGLQQLKILKKNLTGR
jgi:hypothetical protein